MSTEIRPQQSLKFTPAAYFNCTCRKQQLAEVLLEIEDLSCTCDRAALVLPLKLKL